MVYFSYRRSCTSLEGYKAPMDNGETSLLHVGCLTIHAFCMANSLPGTWVIEGNGVAIRGVILVNLFVCSFVITYMHLPRSRSLLANHAASSNSPSRRFPCFERLPLALDTSCCVLLVHLLFIHASATTQVCYWTPRCSKRGSHSIAQLINYISCHIQCLYCISKH